MKRLLAKAITGVLALCLSVSSMSAEEIYSGEQSFPEVSIKISFAEAPEDNIPALEPAVAWVEDENGNITETQPIAHLINEDGRVVSNSRAVPNDGYVYIFDRYDLSTISDVSSFRGIGQYSLTNTFANPVTATYEQSETKTSAWSVAASISASATIEAAFLAKVTASAGLTCTKSHTTQAGTKIGASTTVNPGQKVTFTAYIGGASASGTLVYKKYSPSGTSFLGQYYNETASGTAVKTGAYYVVVS